jgi:hypothetical protein
MCLALTNNTVLKTMTSSELLFLEYRKTWPNPLCFPKLRQEEKLKYCIVSSGLLWLSYTLVYFKKMKFQTGPISVPEILWACACQTEDSSAHTRDRPIVAIRGQVLFIGVEHVAYDREPFSISHCPRPNLCSLPAAARPRRCPNLRSAAAPHLSFPPNRTASLLRVGQRLPA